VFTEFLDDNFPWNAEKISGVINHYANVVTWAERENLVCVFPHTLATNGDCAIRSEGNGLPVYDSNLSRHLSATARRRLDVRFLRAALSAAFPLARDRPVSRPFSQEPTSDLRPNLAYVAPLLWQYQ